MPDTATPDTTRPPDPLDLAALRKVALKVNNDGQSLGKYRDKPPGQVCLNCGFDTWWHEYDAGESCPSFKKLHWDYYQNATRPHVILSLLDRIEELEELVRASRAEADACVLYGNAHHHSDALVDDQNRAVKRRD